MFLPPTQKFSSITFHRNGETVGIIVYNSGVCDKYQTKPEYTYGCETELSYTLTIPAEYMTKSEQGSVWSCFYPAAGDYKSENVTLHVASKFLIWILIL